MGLSHILQVKVPFCTLQVPTGAQEIVFHIPQVPTVVQGTVFHTHQVLTGALEIVCHTHQVPMAVLVKVASHSLEQTDFFHIQQAHQDHRIAQDDLLEDSR